MKPLITLKNHRFTVELATSTVLIFDEYGLLTPAEGIPVTIDDLYDSFVSPFPNSTTRSRLFHDWTKYNKLLRQEIGVDFIQWVNGSFVTMKPNPRDIDLVSFIPSRLFREFEKRLDYYWTDNWEQEEIDAYLIEVFQKNQEAYNLSESRTQEWNERYTKTKPVGSQPINSKGYLILTVR